jgi:hypothetical protein
MGLSKNLTNRDRHALMYYLGLVLLCAVCFAAGIFTGRATVTSTTPRNLSSGSTAQPVTKP